MQDFLMFRRMLTPVMIHIYFWSGIIGAFIGGVALGIYASSLTDNGSFQFVVGLFAFIFAFVVSGLFWKTICEVLIVFFRMNETLSEMRRELRQIEENQSETN